MKAINGFTRGHIHLQGTFLPACPKWRNSKSEGPVNTLVHQRDFLKNLEIGLRPTERRGEGSDYAENVGGMFSLIMSAKASGYGFMSASRSLKTTGEQK
ncbi:hypothetical protein CEXT_776971 [Caerostris extrusa]|uniref:Uncharacterized protein n=1 Tax=Caerostris extrusa TaxID=172846 RepID=A0AAV4SLC9_CAEEX|nr:hypothetical protein CEXT_776971 [Caerostris extrusa]